MSVTYKQETKYVIEWTEGDFGDDLYDAKDDWIADINEAHYFDTREEASFHIKNKGYIGVRVIEHIVKTKIEESHLYTPSRRSICLT